MVKERMFAKALELASAFHCGQEDRGGKPYILHPIRVALAGQTMDERIVGVLHDVVEDTHCTLEDLEEAGFTPKIINAVDALTRREDKETYHEFITRIIGSGRLAVSVKINDMNDNLDPSRLYYLSEEEQQRLKVKYIVERERLRSALRSFPKEEEDGE